MKAYLAGPMSGIKDLNFPAFHAWARYLRDSGHEIINPAELNRGADEAAQYLAMDPVAKAAHWRACMCRDITELVTCDGIFMMPGWEKSKGATLEHHIAQALGMHVNYLTERA